MHHVIEPLKISCITYFVAINNYIEGIWWAHLVTPRGFPSLPIERRDKTISIKVEVIDAPSSTKIGWSWFYVMTTIVPSVFMVFMFSHQGKIVTIGQLTYYKPELYFHDRHSISFVGDSPHTFENIKVGMFKFSLLTGTFPFSPTYSLHSTSTINMISSINNKYQGPHDSWVVPSSLDLDIYVDYMPLSTTKLTYQAIQIAIDLESCFQ